MTLILPPVPVEVTQGGTEEAQAAPTGPGPTRVLHIINDLSIGGAEMMLYKLLSSLNRERFEPVVISLMDRGALRRGIEELGIPVHTAGMRPGWPTPASLARFLRLIRRIEPDLIQGWMYHGGLAASFATLFLAKKIPILWNIQYTVHSLACEKRLTAGVIKLCALISKSPAHISFVSQASRSRHQAFGYSVEKSCVIPNGIDTDRFVPSPEARSSVRSELGLPEDSFLIGKIGRFHQMKDHANFLQAASLLAKEHPHVHFLLAGRGVEWENESLRRSVAESGLLARTHMLGERRDMPRLIAALDVFTLTSAFGEGLPNVVGEAMSCAVPCVVTDVGGSPWIVGEVGRVVPPRDPQALADAWKEMIDLGPEGRGALGAAARSAVTECFSLRSVVTQYETLYEFVLNPSPKKNVAP